MIKYFCDKCDKELENCDIFTITVTPPEIRRWDDAARTGDCILCRECLDAFQGWLEVIEETEKLTEEEIDTILAKTLMGQPDCAWR